MAINQFYQPVSLDELGDSYQKDQAAQAAQVTAPVVTETPSSDPAITQKPFSAEQDKTPGFFGALKDAYSRSSLAKGNNSFNAPNIFESLAYSALHRNAPQPTDKPKGFLGKLGQDAIAIGAGLPIALSHPIETAKATVIGGTPDDDIITRLGKGAIIESVGQVFDKQYYKDHPGLAALNTGGWIGTLASFGLSKVVGSAIKVGITRGIEEAALSGAERVAVTTALKTANKSGAVRMAVGNAMKSGEQGIVVEVAKQALVKQGIAEEQAVQIATKFAEGIGGHLEGKSGAVKLLSAGAHPISTLTDGAGAAINPLKKLVFGETPNSAVGRIYGAETVSKNPQGFLDIEKWASQQAVERGLKDTVANRESIMTDWSKTVSEWSVLTPEERVAYHQNYVRASEMSQSVAKLTGDTVVPTKFLAPQYVDAMKQTIVNAPESMSPIGILDELQSIYGNDIKLHRQSLDRLLASDPTREALAAGIEALGNRETLSYNNLPEAKALVKQLEETTGYRLVEAPSGKPISYATPEAQALDSLPKGENILYHGTDAKGADAISKEGLVVQTGRSSMNKKTGISLSGDVSMSAKYTGKNGGKVFAYQISPEARLVDGDTFNSLVKEKYSGNTLRGEELAKNQVAEELKAQGYDGIDYRKSIASESVETEVRVWNVDKLQKIDTQVGSDIPTVNQLTKVKTKLGQMFDRLGLSSTGGNEGSLEYLFQDNFNQSSVKQLASKYGESFKVNHETVPFSKLYDYLDARRSQIFERKDIAGSVGQILAPGTGGVVDMTVSDLVHAGFAESLAKDIVNVSKKALTDIPFEKTGLADGIANYAKAHVPGYSQFMKVAMNGRFNINPFYGLQAWVELEFNKATALGGDVKAIAKGVSFGERTDARIAKVLEKIPYLKDAVNPPLNFTEIKLVGDELLGDVRQNTLSAASNPEMAMLQRGGQFGGSPAEMQAYAKSIQSKNITFRALGYTTQRAATGFAKALAEKYGFSIEEALSSKLVNGQKVYNNPEMFNMLREATSDLTGYKPGFLTSPLAKTMNAIWFPFRFQAKTVAGVAEAVSKLPPITRIGVMSDWTHFANWSQTPEGVKWRQENSHSWYNTLNYVFTWESSGRGIADVLDGKLFGGNTGQIGGLPFGFVTNIMQDLGIFADNPQGDSKGYSKQIPKKLMSPATAVVIIEDLVSHVFPKMPFYSLFNGNISSAETYVKKNIIEGVYADILDKAQGGEGVGAKAKFQRTQFKTLKPGENRF